MFFDPAGALRLPALRGLMLVGLAGALRLPTLRGLMLMGLAGALRLPALQDPDVKAITTQ
ncbi:hypothetical protein AUM81_01130 [Cronobacter sakazakii]|nr:hypothetical protein AUM81_01130 [Cronobacter sakazakii]HAU5485749.1 hypothetical protein [Cronobacter sakazakii]